VTREGLSMSVDPVRWPTLHDELLAVVAEEGRRLGAHPALAGPHEQDDVARWLTSVLHVAVQTNLWARADRPGFVEITGPTLRWGGDNPDATYAHIAVSADHTYLVRVRPGSAVYSSLTIYGGPRDGHYSTRIVGSLRLDEVPVGPDGWCELLLARDLGGRPGIELADDAEVGVTRDYYRERVGRIPTAWTIQAIEGPGPEPDLVGAGLERTITWLRDQAAIVPVVLEPNVVQDPYPVPEHTFGWAAGDAAYAMGAYELAAGERLVLRGRSPECAFWNVCLWNPLLHSFDSLDGTPTSLHDGEVVLDDDGSWTITVSTAGGGGPNALSTQGRTAGLIWFRWFLPNETPGPVSVVLIPPG
jgi:hypothetical protein